MATATDLDEIKEVNANCILMANLQQASTSGTQTDRAPVYDSDGSAESVYQEQCLTKKINALHLSSSKQITTLNEEIANLNNQLSKEKSIVSSLQEEKKKLKFDFKIRKDEQAQHKQQSLYNGKVLLEKHDPLAVYDSEKTLQLAQEKAAKFVRDFKSLAKESDESLAKHKALEFEIKRLLRAVVSQDIISIVQNPTVVEISDLQIELEQCKYDKILYDKAYNDMQQKIERLQAQLGDLKVHLFDKVSEQKDITKGTSVNTQFRKQSILGKPPSSFGSKLYSVTPFLKSKGLPKIDETHALSKPVTSNSVPTPQESKVEKIDNVIAPGMFKINPFKTSREEKSMPNKPIKASVRIKPIIISQPHVLIKKCVNSNSNGLFSIGVDTTAKTRRPQPRSNTKNDRVPSTSKSSCSKNNEVEVEEHPRNLLLSKNKKHMSYECNNIKLAIRNDKFEVVCAMCKQCLITANHDVCVLNYVNDMNSCGKKQKPKVMKPKKAGSNERLASPKPSKPRSCLRWSPTGRLFDLKGKIIASSKSESQSDCSKGDNACTSNP
ncbi:hypothetical protein Tco_1311058 [Tanacetum coccineum]